MNSERIQEATMLRISMKVVVLILLIWSVGTVQGARAASATVPISCEEAAQQASALCYGCIGDPSPYGCCTDDLTDPSCCYNFYEAWCNEWGGAQRVANGCGEPGHGGECCCECEGGTYPYGYFC